MNANILRLLRRMFLKVCTVHDSNSSNSIFSKISIERMFLKLKKISMQILKHFHRRKFKKLSEKIGKIQKKPIFLTCYCNDLQTVNNNTNMMARMLLI